MEWSWVGARISNLWCFCPDCDSELVYDDSSCNQFSRLSSLETPHTKFICEHCNRRVVSTVKGGNKFYVKGAVERAIRRKLRKEK